MVRCTHAHMKSIPAALGPLRAEANLWIGVCLLFAGHGLDSDLVGISKIR